MNSSVRMLRALQGLAKDGLGEARDLGYLNAIAAVGGRRAFIRASLSVDACWGAFYKTYLVSAAPVGTLQRIVGILAWNRTTPDRDYL